MKNFSSIIAVICLLLVSSAAFARDLKLGASGEDVKAWQRFLVSRNFDLPVNGKFGPSTDRATKIFQKKWKLYADGVVGKQTLQKAKSLGLGVASSNGINRPVRSGEKNHDWTYTVESQVEAFKNTDSATLQKIVRNYTAEIERMKKAKDNEVRLRGPNYDPSSYDNMMHNLQISVDAATRVLNSRR